MLTFILKKTGLPNLLEVLTERLASSELNTLLLEVFRRKAARVDGAGLMRSYRENRFVQPAAVNALEFMEWSLQWMRAAAGAGFQPLRLSPVGPLGCCSALGPVHQDKVLSALRGVEVAADATNLLALESSLRRREQGFPAETLHFSAVHQHLRTQELKLPGHTAHFTVLVLTSAGRDTGDFSFEKENLLRHLEFYRTVLPEHFNLPAPHFRINVFRTGHAENRLATAALDYLRQNRPEWDIETVYAEQSSQNYYLDLQFKVLLPGPDGQPIDIADGGFVPWTRTLSGNRKERFLISGLGVQLLFKLFVDC
jgi:hypothetical protein